MKNFSKIKLFASFFKIQAMKFTDKSRQIRFFDTSNKPQKPLSDFEEKIKKDFGNFNQFKGNKFQKFESKNTDNESKSNNFIVDDFEMLDKERELLDFIDNQFDPDKSQLNSQLDKLYEEAKHEELEFSNSPLNMIEKDYEFNEPELNENISLGLNDEIEALEDEVINNIDNLGKPDKTPLKENKSKENENDLLKFLENTVTNQLNLETKESDLFENYKKSSKNLETEQSLEQELQINSKPKKQISRQSSFKINNNQKKQNSKTESENIAPELDNKIKIDENKNSEKENICDNRIEIISKKSQIKYNRKIQEFKDDQNEKPIINEKDINIPLNPVNTINNIDKKLIKKENNSKNLIIQEFNNEKISAFSSKALNYSNLVESIEKKIPFLKLKENNKNLLESHIEKSISILKKKTTYTLKITNKNFYSLKIKDISAIHDKLGTNTKLQLYFKEDINPESQQGYCGVYIFTDSAHISTIFINFGELEKRNLFFSSLLFNQFLAEGLLNLGGNLESLDIIYCKKINFDSPSLLKFKGKDDLENILKTTISSRRKAYPNIRINSKSLNQKEFKRDFEYFSQILKEGKYSIGF